MLGNTSGEEGIGGGVFKGGSESWRDFEKDKRKNQERSSGIAGEGGRPCGG